MKKIHFLLVFVFLCSLTLSAAGYTVFKVKGDVTRVVDGKEITLKPHEKVTLRTVLNIPQGAQVSILNNDTKLLFRSLESGQKSVMSIIREARAQSDAIVSNAYGMIRRSLSEGMAGGTHKPQGLIVRGEGKETISLEQILANGLKTGNYSSESPVSFRRKYNADSTYIYEISSDYPGIVYVNIADVTASPAVLLFDVRYSAGEPFVAVGQGTTDVSAYEFYGGEDHCFVLVASNYPFDVQSVQTMLRSQEKVDNIIGLPEEVKVWLSADK